MPDSFSAGQSDADTGSPGFETMGARYGIKTVRPQRGIQENFTEPYLMPSVAGRNGSMEAVDPQIVHTPLGGIYASSFGAPPPQPDGNVGAFPVSDDGEFGSGIRDGYPEGSPIPVRG